MKYFVEKKVSYIERVEPNNILEWLLREIGESEVNWHWRFKGSLDIFYFVNEEDKVKFILKWL